MLIIGCDFHTRYQQIATLDDATGELTERRLEHESGEAHKFYSDLPRPVRVGVEATGPLAGGRDKGASLAFFSFIIEARLDNNTPDFSKASQRTGGCRTFWGCKTCGFCFLVRNKLERRYGFGHWHFITCSCYRRMPLLGTAKARDIFLKILGQVRERYDFGLFGYVVMPEHIHLLISEPNIANPSTVMKVLKQRVSRALRRRKKSRATAGQMRLWEEPVVGRYAHFWQKRYYDFNVWSERKRNEKMNYMHFNPVKRGLVASPKDWKWSSYLFYWQSEKGLCPPNPEWVDKNWRKTAMRSRL